MSLDCIVDRFAFMGEQTAVLQGGWRVFRSRRRRGAICYRYHFGTALSPGDPLCDPADAPALLEEFLAACRERRWHLVFIPSSERFARLAGQMGCAGWKIGECPVFDLKTWGHAGRSGAKLRAALNRAGRAGVEAVEWHPERDLGIPRFQLRSLHDAWLASTDRVPLGFILGADLLAPRHGRRWFVASKGRDAQALVVTAALPSRNAVAIEHFIRRPGAEYGSVETAVVAAFGRHRLEGVESGLLATAPLRGLAPRSTAEANLVGRRDRGHQAAVALLRIVREQGALYPARTLEHFKAKFNPARWQSVYLVHYPARLLPRMGLAAAMELFPGGPQAWGGPAVKSLARSLAPCSQRL